MTKVTRKRDIDRKTIITRRTRKRNTNIRMDFRGRTCGKTWRCRIWIRRGT